MNGPLPQVGSPAPPLRFVRTDKSDGSLKDLAGNVVIVYMMPSVDTSTCALETRTFNQKAAGLGLRVLAVSMDLPFALKRFCGAEGIVNVEAVSDFRFRDAGDQWGTRITEGPMNGTLGRVTFVIDKGGVVRHAEVAAELGMEPDYEAALATANGLL